jgi:hypothetical protein
MPLGGATPLALHGPTVVRGPPPSRRSRLDGGPLIAAAKVFGGRAEGRCSVRYYLQRSGSWLKVGRDPARAVSRGATSRQACLSPRQTRSRSSRSDKHSHRSGLRSELTAGGCKVRLNWALRSVWG